MGPRAFEMCRISRFGMRVSFGLGWGGHFRLASQGFSDPWWGPGRLRCVEFRVFEYAFPLVWGGVVILDLPRRVFWSPGGAPGV